MTLAVLDRSRSLLEGYTFLSLVMIWVLHYGGNECVSTGICLKSKGVEHILLGLRLTFSSGSVGWFPSWRIAVQCAAVGAPP